jgi:anaerobic selenocysteine-containing dehydrogenase
MKKEENISRREFFRTCGRGVIAGGLATIAAVMWKRKASLSNQECINQGICRQCGVFEKCELPQALSVKKVRPQVVEDFVSSNAQSNSFGGK